MTREQIEQAAREYRATGFYEGEIKSQTAIYAEKAFIAGAESRQSEIDDLAERVKTLASIASSLGAALDEIYRNSKKTLKQL